MFTLCSSQDHLQYWELPLACAPLGLDLGTWKLWLCKISSYTLMLLGKFNLHTKRNLDLRFCHPTLKYLHSAFHRTISSIGTWQLPHGLCSSWPRQLRKETYAEVVGPHWNQVETKAPCVRQTGFFQLCRIDLNYSWLSTSSTLQVENHSNVDQTMWCWPN